MTADNGKPPKAGSRVRRKAAPVQALPQGAQAAVQADPRHKTIAEEWRAMGPFSKIMAVLGLFGFIVGIPGWLSSEYWLGKNPAAFIVPPAIAEQLRPEQLAQLTQALSNLQENGVRGATGAEIDRALEAASAGNLQLAEGLLEQAYKKSAADAAVAHSDQARAARQLAALSIVTDAQKALALYRQSVTLDPAAPEGWLGLGDAALVAGTLVEATDAYRRFLTLTPLEAAPQLHAAGVDRLGDALLGQGDQAGALAAYEKGIAISRQMANREPEVAEWRRNLTVSLKKKGDVLLEQGAFEDAKTANAEAIAITRSLIGVSPGDRKLQRDLSAYLGVMGETALRQGDKAAARKAYDEALDISRDLLRAAPDDPGALNDLSIYLVKTGDLHVAENKASAASDAYFEAFKIRDGLVRLDPANSRWQRDLMVNLIKIGDLKAGAGNPAEALQSYEHARLIAKALTEQDPANAAQLRDLSVCVDKAGDAKRTLGDSKGAIADHSEGLDIIARLARRYPGNAELQRDLIVGHFNLAEDGADPQANYAKASAQAQSMKDRGILMQSDEWMIADLARRAAEAAPKQ